MNTKLTQLLSELLDGTLDDAHQRRLAELLRDNDDAQQAYCDVMALHALLKLDLGNGDLQLPPIVPSGDATFPDRPNFEIQRPQRRWRLAAVVAASIALIAWSGIVNEPPGDLSKSSDNRPRFMKEMAEGMEKQAVTVNAPAVAVLGQASRAKWTNPDVPTDTGSSLHAGKFELLEGLVQVEFFSGAAVIIEAPAVFELVSSKRIVCTLGKIRAHVPSQAKGFTIETPKYNAVDLGTEFTVRVEQSGESQFQVLDGEVEIWNESTKPSILAQLLTAGQGVRSTSDGRLTEIDAIASGFVGRKQMLEMATEAMQERYKNWQSFSQQVRSRPGILIYYGFDGHAAWDRVLRNQTLAGGESLDGAIVGCQWTDGRWHGKKALEFKRTSDRVRLNVPGEFESLSFAAWLRVEGLERWLSSLLLTDGHQPGEVHWQMTDMGQLMLGVKAEEDRSHDFFSPSVLGPIDLGRWVHLACVYNGREGYVAHYMDGAEISREQIRIPTKLRIGPAEIGNWVPQDLKDFRIRSLNGRIDEFLLSELPLTPAEVHKIYEAGRPQ